MDQSHITVDVDIASFLEVIPTTIEFEIRCGQINISNNIIYYKQKQINELRLITDPG